MTDSTLEFTRENYEGHLRDALERIAAGRRSPADFFMTTLSYRVLAICALLLDADRDVFAMRLSKSGSSRLAFLRLVHDGLQVSPQYLCASKNMGFSAALAAGDIEVARNIASLSAGTPQAGVEYEDDFLFVHFLHRIVSAPEDGEELNRILTRWEGVLEDGHSGYLDVCKSLIIGNQAEFEAGFESLLQYRKNQLKRYKQTTNFDEQMFAAEGKVFIEGLAVLRVAEVRGLVAPDELPLIPSTARVPLGTPLPGPDSWRAP